LIIILYIDYSFFCFSGFIFCFLGNLSSLLPFLGCIKFDFSHNLWCGGSPL